jgi:hypothetical protein
MDIGFTGQKTRNTRHGAEFHPPDTFNVPLFHFSVNSTSLFQNRMTNIDKPERKVPSRAAALGRQRDNGPGARHALSPENQQMNN